MPRRDFSRTLRSLNDGTEKRRQGRSRRRSRFMLAVAIFCAMVIICLPSALSLSPFIHSLVRSAAGEYGWDVTAKDIRIGWLTPLRILQLEVVGPSGKTIVIAESLDAEITVIDLLRGRQDWGEFNIDSPRLEAIVSEGGSSLEQDLSPFLTESESTTPFAAQIVIRNAGVKLKAENSERAWRADQLQAAVKINNSAIDVECDAVVTDPDKISGTLQAHLQLSPDDSNALATQINASGLPLSVLELVSLRLPETASSLPEQWSGNATGKVNLLLQPDGAIELQAQPIDLRNLVVLDQRITGEQPWKVGQAWIEGKARWVYPVLECQQVSIQTDAGQVKLNGSVDADRLSAGDLVSSIRGNFETDFDLAVLTQSTPGLVPIRNDVSIQSGRVQASITSAVGDDQQLRTSLLLVTEPVSATVLNGSPITLQPLAADIVLRPTENWIVVDRLQAKSSFGEATANGDRRGGKVDFKLDLAKLDELLRSILEMPSERLKGLASGNFTWSIQEQNRWILSGSATALNIAIPISDTTSIKREKMDVVANAEGVFGASSLSELKRANFLLTEPGQSWEIALAEPVVNPTSETLYPVMVQGNGNIDTIANLLSLQLETADLKAEGHVAAKIQGSFGTSGGILRAADLALTDAVVRWNGQAYQQKSIKTQFTGAYDWQAGTLLAEKFTLSANAVSLAMQGSLDNQQGRLEVAYRADLNRLQQVMVVPPQPPTGGTKSQGAVQLQGTVEGTADFGRKNGNAWEVRFATKVNQFQANQLTNGQLAVLWEEPTVSLAGVAEKGDTSPDVRLRELKLQSEWVETMLDGIVAVDAETYQANLRGPTKIKMESVSQRVTKLLGEPVLARGTHETDLLVNLTSSKTESLAFDATTSIGWDSAELTGIKIGAAKVPVRVTEETLFVDGATLPLERGQLHLAGAVHYGKGDLWIEQNPGVFAEAISITPDMCRSWLKYMMPLVADATDVNGTFSVDLEECVYFPNDPVRSRVVGALRVETAAIGPGPMARNLIGAIDQLEAAAKGLSGAAPAQTNPQQWLQMNPQAIDFAMAGGQVAHQRMMANVGKVTLISSGSVSIDGRLNLGIQVPLEAAWLGKNLESLAGQTLTLPVTGTINQPSINTQAVAQTIGGLGVQAVQSSAENYLQKQLDRQLQKLFGN